MPLLENLEKQGNYLFKYRGTLPLAIVCTGILLDFDSRLSLYKTMNTLGFRSYELLCLAVALTGLFIRIVTVGYTPEGTSGRNTDQQEAASLNTSGMYSMVRHPLYLANFFMWLGACLMIYNFSFTIIIILIFWIYYERIMFAEEQFLRRKYGEVYLNWASKTPTFIPRFRNWSSPSLSFNYRKVLRQEKTGFCALLILFFILDFTREIGNLKIFFSEEWYWTMGLIIGLLSYLILKFLKYKTTVLKDKVP